jgi:hypothetical protein
MLVKYRVMETIAGRRPADEVFVIHWGMRDMKPRAEAGFQAGDCHVLECEPFEVHKELKGYPVANDVEGSLEKPWFLVLRWWP